MIKKFTLLLLAMLSIAGISKADETVDVYTKDPQDLSAWKSNEEPEKYLAVSYNDKGELANALMTDIVMITYTMKDSESDYYIKLSDPAGWDDLEGSQENLTYQSGSQSYSFTINKALALDIIKNRGLIIRGNNVTVTGVKLTKKDGRYDAMPVIIGEKGYATWSCEKKLNFNGTGVTPYYASAVSEGVVTLSSISEAGKENTTWDYQGYIVIGEQGTYSIPVEENDKTYYPGTNFLIGSSNGEAKVFKSHYTEYVFTEGDFWYNDESDKTAKENRIKNKYRYIFAKHGDNIGFYMLSTTYSESEKAYHTLAARKAYLETDDDLTPKDPSTPAPALNLIFGGEGEGTTGINTVSKNPVVEDGIYYNLQGVAVKNPSKGLYILNGKKVIVK